MQLFSVAQYISEVAPIPSKLVWWKKQSSAIKRELGSIQSKLCCDYLLDLRLVPCFGVVEGQS